MLFHIVSDLGHWSHGWRNSLWRKWKHLSLCSQLCVCWWSSNITCSEHLQPWSWKRWQSLKMHLKGLTHWGWVMHICINNLIIIGSDNGLLPGRRQAIIWTNAGILLIGPLGTNFSEILIEILKFLLKEKICIKMSSVKWRPFCLGLNLLTHWGLVLKVNKHQWAGSSWPMKMIQWMISTIIMITVSPNAQHVPYWGLVTQWKPSQNLGLNLPWISHQGPLCRAQSYDQHIYFTFQWFHDNKLAKKIQLRC